MSGMGRSQALVILKKIQDNQGAVSSKEMWEMWDAIMGAVTDETAVHDPMAEPDFSLDEIELAEKMIERENGHQDEIKEAYDLLEAKHRKIIDQEYRAFLKRNNVELTREQKEATLFRRRARKMAPPDFTLDELEIARKLIDEQ